MDNDKILEIARRHMSVYKGDHTYSCTSGDLIAFAEAVIETEREQTAIKVPIAVWDKLKDVNTVTDLVKALKAAEEE